MKRDYDIRAREHQFKEGDAVYWRRNAGKKVESMLVGLGVIFEAKPETVFAVKSCWEDKIMHLVKLKKCDTRKLPKWLVDYMRLRQSKSPCDLGDHPDGKVGASTSAKDPADIATKERQPNGPLWGTRSHYKGITKHDEIFVAKPPSGTEKGI